MVRVRAGSFGCLNRWDQQLGNSRFIVCVNTKLRRPGLQGKFRVQKGQLTFKVLLSRRQDDTYVCNENARRVSDDGAYHCHRERSRPLPPHRTRMRRVLCPRRVVQLSQFYVLLVCNRVEFCVCFAVGAMVIIDDRTGSGRGRMSHALFPLAISYLTLARLNSAWAVSFYYE